MTEYRFTAAFSLAFFIGIAFWSASFGVFHALAVCVDWTSPLLTEETMQHLGHPRPVIALVVMGALFGVSTQGIAFLASHLRLQRWVFFGPLLMGIGVGILQACATGTDVWGFTALDIPLRSLGERVGGGILCGVLGTAIFMPLCAFIRQAREQMHRRNDPF